MPTLPPMPPGMSAAASGTAGMLPTTSFVAANGTPVGVGGARGVAASPPNEHAKPNGAPQQQQQQQQHHVAAANVQRTQYQNAQAQQHHSLPTASPFARFAAGLMTPVQNVAPTQPMLPGASLTQTANGYANQPSPGQTSSHHALAQQPGTQVSFGYSTTPAVAMHSAVPQTQQTQYAPGASPAVFTSTSSNQVAPSAYANQCTPVQTLATTRLQQSPPTPGQQQQPQAPGGSSMVSSALPHAQAVAQALRGQEALQHWIQSQHSQQELNTQVLCLVLVVLGIIQIYCPPGHFFRGGREWREEGIFCFLKVDRTLIVRRY